MPLWEKIALGLAVRILRAKLPALIARAKATKTPWDDHLWRAVETVIDAYGRGALIPPKDQ
jgi:hypothetical protein